MSNHSKLHSNYNTTISDCFSKFKDEINHKKDFKTDICKKEQMLDKYLNTINILGFNNEDGDPSEIVNVEAKRPKPHRRRTRSQFTKKSLTSMTPFNFHTIDKPINQNTINTYTDRKSYYHKPKVSSYPFSQTLSSTKSDHKFRMITQQYSTLPKSKKQDYFLTQINHRKSKPFIQQESRIQTVSTIRNTKNKKNKSNSLPRLSFKDIRLAFPKKRFDSIYQDFTMFTHRIDALLFKLKKDTKEMIRPIDDKAKEKLKEAKMVNENPIPKSRNISSVLNKASGTLNMIDKANADLINFGDHYLKINDEEFYRRSKEILQDYEYIRHHAKIAANLPQKQSKRFDKFRKNEFIIAKAFQLVQNDHTNFIKTFDNFYDKGREISKLASI